MFHFHLYALFMAGALALNLTPGPDMTFVLAQAAHRGTRAGLAAALGIGTGAIFYTILTAFGLAALFAAWPLAFDIVRYVGAAYLVWIAIGMLRRPLHLSAPDTEQSVRAAFRQGVLTDVLNPKVAIFFIAFLPQFVVRDAGPAWLQILLLGIAFVASGTAVNCAVALGGGRLADRLRANPVIGKILGWISASVMLGLALRLAWLERR
ncbi:MAG: LysE family translocator [Alphaproteobacteria bacterium]|nr:LysE family translocator [Alphaproteobacteria bacterium]MDE2629507.1 LysE family translocator [Alphaproteobacteria bacterium]